MYVTLFSESIDETLEMETRSSNTPLVTEQTPSNEVVNSQNINPARITTTHSLESELPLNLTVPKNISQYDNFSNSISNAEKDVYLNTVSSENNEIIIDKENSGDLLNSKFYITTCQFFLNYEIVFNFLLLILLIS